MIETANSIIQLQEQIIMSTFDTFFFIIELISITSFGISGALAAIRKNLDVFGVVIIGVVTSIGGGIIRDLVLGIHPPKSFGNPIYAFVAAVCALGTFIIEYRHVKKRGKPNVMRQKIVDSVMFWLDSTGLAIFSVVGVATAYELEHEYSMFLLCFVGTITGVGGGLLRDTMINNMPYIFVKHFYASACIIGSFVCAVLWNILGRIPAMIIGTVVIMILRFLAMYYHWNLPHVPNSDPDESPVR